MTGNCIGCGSVEYSSCRFPFFTPTDGVLSNRFHPAEIGPLFVSVAVGQSSLPCFGLKSPHSAKRPPLLFGNHPDSFLSHRHVFIVRRDVDRWVGRGAGEVIYSVDQWTRLWTIVAATTYSYTNQQLLYFVNCDTCNNIPAWSSTLYSSDSWISSWVSFLLVFELFSFERVNFDLLMA